MKILHVITSLRTGGAEHLLVDLLPRLKSEGHDVSLLLFDGTRTPFYEELETKGIQIKSLGVGARNMYNPFWVFRLNGILRNFDIIHTHNTPCQLLVAMASIASSRYHLVTTEHSTSNRRRKWKWYRFVDRWMYRMYQSIICVSQDAADNLSASLLDNEIEKRIKVIPNGVDIGRFSNVDSHTSYPLKKNPDTVAVMMVAAFRKGKDQPTLIRAMSLLPENFHLYLIGDGECRPQCEAMAATCRVSGRVHFLGIRTDIPILLKSADMVVLSSLYEGLSLSCIEGMASGRPFIASDVDGLRDIVKGAGLLFPYGDSRALADLLLQLTSDRELSKKTASACQARARQYDITHMVQGYLQVYQNLL